VALLLALAVGGRAITHEGAFFLQGDPPRYLMNGLFLYDWIGSGAGWRLEDVLNHAERYYARYPALSLGHHMPFLPVALVPFYAVFGVSVFAARLAILFSFVLSAFLLYRVVTHVYGQTVAGWSAVLFVTSPIMGSFGQRVLAEMPAIALVMVALHLIQRFRASGRLRDYLLFILFATGALFCRPTAAFMFPAYVAFLLMAGGSARFRQRPVAIATLLGVALVTAAALATLVLSPFNAGFVGRVLTEGLRWQAVTAVLSTLASERPLFLALLAGCVAAAVHRDRRVLVPLVWAVSVLGSAVALTGDIEPGRYAVLAVPAYCVVAASLSAYGRDRSSRAAIAAVLACAAGLQLWGVLQRPTLEAPGYEQAAAYVLSQTPAATVLYSASIDTGYFVFFTRKHDSMQRLVVLRSDKLLTTSLMGRLSVENLIQGPSDIYPILRRFGTRFVVIEDRPSGSAALDWLRDELRTDRFVERGRFPIGDASAELKGVSLAVYEFREAGEAEPGASLDLNLPLAGRRIRLPLSELLPAEAAR
jgi:hypothetical protein